MTLRGVSPHDAEAIARLLGGDTELALQTAGIPIPYTIESARAYLKIADPQQLFLITDGSEVAGAIGFHGPVEPIEIGYWIGRRYWGLGYATAAVKLLVEKARSRSIAHLAAEVFPGNPASIRVLEKNGFIRERIVYKDLPQRGGMRELIRFHLLLDAAMK